MKNWLQLFRVQDYVKNLLVFFPAFFGGKILYNNHLPNLALLFLLFCFLCSGVYIINDLFDYKWDQNHPDKKNKPLTSGAVKRNTAIALALLLVAIALIGAGQLSKYVLIQFTIYFAVNIFYSAFGKHVPFLDLFIIMFGFLIRIQAGSVITGVPISAWLYLIIILFAFGFGLVKRLEEIRLLNQHGIDSNKVRPALRYYAENFAKPAVTGIVSSAGLAYVAYTLSPETMERLGSDFVFISCAPVLFAIYQYLKLLKQGEISIMPQYVLLHSKPILLSVMVWLVMMVYFIYL
jgi:4-hydroxybenzoate polyprenyltransferase